jgi:hypothetical protein
MKIRAVGDLGTQTVWPWMILIFEGSEGHYSTVYGSSKLRFCNDMLNLLCFYLTEFFSSFWSQPAHCRDEVKLCGRRGLQTPVPCTQVRPA